MSETEKLATITVDLCNALEAAAVNAKRQIAELYTTELEVDFQTKPKPPVAVLELTFNFLTFRAQEGAKLGEYEIAYKASNLEDKWQTAYNVLRNSNATIKERYYGEGYQFSYWLYGEDKIYRQRLNTTAKAER